MDSHGTLPQSSCLARRSASSMSSRRAGSKPGWSRIMPFHWLRWIFPLTAAPRRIRRARPARRRCSPACSMRAPANSTRKPFIARSTIRRSGSPFPPTATNSTGHLQTLSRNIDQAFELLALARQRAASRCRAIERVRGQINAVLKREAKDPDNMAAQAWRRAAWPGHPYSGRRAANWARSTPSPATISSPARDAGARQSEDRGRRRHRRRDARAPSRRSYSAACRRRRSSTPIAEVEIAGPGPAHPGRFRRAAGQYPLRPSGPSPPRPDYHRRHGGQSHSRRRRFLLASVAGGAREARPGLFGLFDARDRRT